VQGEFLTRHENVGEHDRGLDNGAAVQFAGRLHETLVAQERLDAVDAHVVAVGVGLAEVIGSRRQRCQILDPSQTTAGADEIAHGVVARRQPLANHPRKGGLLGVGSVGAETLAQAHHGLCLGVGQEWIEYGVALRRHAISFLGSSAPAGTGET
jgi:hypothetical protein